MITVMLCIMYFQNKALANGGPAVSKRLLVTIYL